LKAQEMNATAPGTPDKTNATGSPQ
jgi:hypothetical protein